MYIVPHAGNSASARPAMRKRTAKKPRIGAAALAVRVSSKLSVNIARMQVYLVGGAVRDQLLGLPVRERDWVVVGARPEELKELGYLPVGREFPVFLHPETKEEYALARLESKVAPGYRGFHTQSSPDVTLQEDLRRRDLTINAIAQSSDGEIIDPYGGADDLKKGILRHVSEAFVEDPVRVLRVARFAARFADRGFSVAPETRDLMQEMVKSGEIDALVPERVWQETERALGEAHPEVFFLTLRDCGALQAIFPEIEALFGVPQPERWHPEIDTGLHVMLALQCAVRLRAPTPVRFAVLVHDLGKAKTPRNLWPSHHGHEEAGVALIEALAARLRVPKEHTELAVLTARHHGLVHRALELKPATILGLLEKTDALRRPDRFRALLLACEADARGRTGLEDRAYPQADFLRQAQEATATEGLTEEERQGLLGTAIKEKLREKRLQVLTSMVTRYHDLLKAKAIDPGP
jgi:tRNA nucleotidyltransferase (CCA-adding enzyme)